MLHRDETRGIRRRREPTPLLSPVLSCTLNLKTFGRLDLLADVALLEEGDRAEGHVVRVNGTGTGTLVSLDAAPVAGAAAAPARVDAALASTETTLAALAVAATGALGDAHALLGVLLCGKGRGKQRDAGKKSQRYERGNAYGHHRSKPALYEGARVVTKAVLLVWHSCAATYTHGADVCICATARSERKNKHHDQARLRCQTKNRAPFAENVPWGERKTGSTGERSRCRYGAP